MEENFVSASARHLMDAKFLSENNRMDNAGYLAGYAVECSLKAIIIQSQGPDPKAYGHDLSTLGGAALDLSLLLSPGLRRYRAETIGEIVDAFKDWEPSWRYRPTGTVSGKAVENLLIAADKAFYQIIIPIVLDGWEEVPK